MTTPNNDNSCITCRWLFTRDTGYSNYTVIDTEAHCVHERNDKLPTDIPDDVGSVNHWDMYQAAKWVAVNNGRCELYQEGTQHHIDCDGDELVGEKQGKRIMLEQGDPMPLLIAQYYPLEMKWKDEEDTE